MFRLEVLQNEIAIICSPLLDVELNRRRPHVAQVVAGVDGEGVVAAIARVILTRVRA